MKKKITKIIAMLLSIVMLCSVMMMPASALWVGSYTYNNADGEKVYNIFLWNQNNKTNNNYTLYSELTQYAASNYNFGAVFSSMYGYNISSNTWEWVNYDDMLSELDRGYMWYGCSTRSLDKAFASNELEVTSFIPEKASATVVLGTYSDTQTSYYNKLYYYKASSSSELERTYFHIDHQKTYTTDWNMG
ncbi:MAG: hypothetical protein UHG68_03590 [Clostridia bacterium]|nr:hypothetical protein [Clostridia bacterium]